jgi:hypothetical protein
VSFFPVFVSLLIACSETGRNFPIIEQKCGKCHSPAVVYRQKRTEADWQRVLHGMKMRGLVITPAEEAQVVKVLKENLLLEERQK